MRYYHQVVLFVLAADTLVSLAKPHPPRWEDMHTMHTWEHHPSGWERLGHPHANITIDLYVALKPYRENALADTLYEVSDPDHPRYGAHLSREQVAELVAPHPDALQHVENWLEYYGVPSPVSLTHGGSTLTITDVPVDKANDLLGASYQIYRHIETNETIVRTVGYALPAALHEHVLHVSPTTEFVIPRTQSHTPPGGAAMGQANLTTASGEPVTGLSRRNSVPATTPMFLRWLYKTLSYEPISLSQNLLGIYGCKRGYPSPTDLTAFMSKYRGDAIAATFKVQLVNNGQYDPTKPNAELNLDVQYAEAIAYPTPVIFYSTGPGRLPGYGPTAFEWFLPWLRYLLDNDDVPKTVSASYGFRELDVPRGYATDVCNKFGQLGLRGITVLFPSGDDGVGAGTCIRDGSVQFIPEFPASCPFVTTVGGTTNYDPEIAASITGGGFSNYFELPPYQQQAVPPYIKGLGKKYKGSYKHVPFTGTIASGRGIPDIAAQALRFPIFLNHKEGSMSGTSGSAPIVTGIIALLNDYRLSKGLDPLGFINPILYGRGLPALTDIKTGSNPGCGTKGFTAGPGWDPLTGLGTLDFEKLLSIISTLP